MNKLDQLLQAIMRGDQPGVTGLLDEDAALVDAATPGGVPAVLFAMYYGETGIVRVFLERKARVDVFTAAALEITGRLKALITEQPELVNAVAPDGFSPLGLAAFFGRKAAVDILLEKGAEVNAASQNPQKVMPLHSAVAGQHLEIARALIEHGADVNAVQADDFTPLQAAAQNGQMEMVRLLLEAGAQVDARCRDGRGALQMAEEHGRTEVAEYLRQLVNK